MAGFNRVIMVGNLTRDPDYKQLASGQAVCRLGLASNRQFKNRQTGTMAQEVCYIDVDVWGAQAESCRQYLQKGRSVLVEGRLKLDSWEDQNGQSRSRHSIVADRIVFLSSQGHADSDATTRQTESQDNGGPQLDPNNPVERDLMNQLAKAKTKLQAAQQEQAPKKKAPERANPMASGEIAFNDSPPFEEDLPF